MADDDLPRPLLLINVDGVLNVHPNARRPVADWQAHSVAGARGTEYTVHLNPRHGEWLNGLSDQYHLVWCTTWGEAANSRIAPLLGLPTDLPVVPLPSSWTEVPLNYAAETPHVRRWAKGRAVTWLDDAIDDRDADALTRRVDPDDQSPLAGSKPCIAAMTLNVDPDIGLTRAHIDRLRAWLPGEAAQARLREERWREMEATWGLLTEAAVALLPEAVRAGLLGVQRPDGLRYPGFQLITAAGGTKVVPPAWQELWGLLAPGGWSDENTLIWTDSVNGYLEGRTPAEEIQANPARVPEALRYAAARALPQR